jgi:hypothetical protein
VNIAVKSVQQYFIRVYPNVAKAGGLQSQGAKGAAVVVYCKTLGNAGYEVLRLSRRVKRWPIIDPILKFTIGLFLTKCFTMAWIPYPQGIPDYWPSFLCNLGVCFGINGPKRRWAGAAQQGAGPHRRYK